MAQDQTTSKLPLWITIDEDIDESNAEMSHVNQLEIKDLSSLSEDALQEVRAKILNCIKSKPKHHSNAIGEHLQPEIEDSGNDSTNFLSGIELHDDNSVIFIPNEEDELSSQSSSYEDGTTVIDLSDADKTLVPAELPSATFISKRKQEDTPLKNVKRSKPNENIIVINDEDNDSDDVSMVSSTPKRLNENDNQSLNLSPIKTGSSKKRRSRNGRKKGKRGAGVASTSDQNANITKLATNCPGTANECKLLATVATTSTSELNVSSADENANVTIKKPATSGGAHSKCNCYHLDQNIVQQLSEVADNVQKLLSPTGPLGILNNFTGFSELLAKLQQVNVVPDKKDDKESKDELKTTETPGNSEASTSAKKADTPAEEPITVKTYSNVQVFFSENIHHDCNFKYKGLKPIVIDGSNIAMSHAHGFYFSVRGLKICIDFFVRRGHKVYAFIPSYRLKGNQSDNPRLLQDLVKKNHVFCTSSWEVYGKKVCSYDDRILLQAAAAMGAVIVSRDNYRDMIQEEPRFANIISQGLLMPTWVGDMIIFPQDPLGRNGPKLNRFLSF